MHNPLRPQFSVRLACPSPVVLQRLGERLDAGPHDLRRTRVPGGGRETQRDRDFYVLTVPDAEQRPWSPWLTIEVGPDGTGGAGALMKGKFGPHPTVWTGFAFFYLTLTVTFLFSLAFTAALASTGGSPWSLYITAGALAGIALLWWVSRVGQRLARAQMAALQAELLAAVRECNLGAEPAEDDPALASALRAA